MDQGWGEQHDTSTQVRQGDKQADCARACPSHPIPEEIRQLKERLVHEQFVTEGGEEHPFLFRSREACERYRTQRPIPKDALVPW
jgi:hypothetical protein